MSNAEINNSEIKEPAREKTLTQETTHTPSDFSSKKRKAVVLGIFTATVVMGILYTLILWHRPLAQDLNSALEEKFGSYSTSTAPEGVIPTPYPTIPIPTPLPDLKPQCGGPAIMHILLVGNDSEFSDYHSTRGFADVIRIVRVDFVEPSVDMLTLPRDLWTPIPGLYENTGFTHNRLKTAYAYGNLFLGAGGGPLLLAQTLKMYFGVQLDHYVIVSFDAFEHGIDAIGGVDVYLEEPFDMQIQGQTPLPSGSIHLDGETALQFARSRPDNSSDLNRVERQTMLIHAIQTKALSPQILPAVPDIVRTMSNAVLTDLSPSDISNLLCIGQRLSTGDITTMELDQTLYTIHINELGYEEFQPDFEGIIKFIWQFQNAQELPPTAIERN